MTDVSTTCAEAIFRVKKTCAEAIFRVKKTLKMTSAQVVETSVTNNSPSQDSYHPDDLFQSRYATPGFKPFSYLAKYVKIYTYQLVDSVVGGRNSSGMLLI